MTLPCVPLHQAQRISDNTGSLSGSGYDECLASTGVFRISTSSVFMSIPWPWGVGSRKVYEYDLVPVLLSRGFGG